MIFTCHEQNSYSCLHFLTVKMHAHFGQSGNTAIKVFTSLYIPIKIGIRHVNTIMLAAIMSLIALFKSKHYVYMR